MASMPAAEHDASAASMVAVGSTLENVDVFRPQHNIAMRFPGLSGLRLQMKVFEIYGVLHSVILTRFSFHT